jgi:acetyltransferase-like isoleucine patch superfamily enzyme
MLQYRQVDGKVLMTTDLRGETGIQEAHRSPSRSAAGRYRDLVIGRPGFGALVLYELVILLTSQVPGALGLLLRKFAYPLILGRVGRNVAFGRGVTLRHPHKIRLGDNVVVDDNVLLDAKGETNEGITIGASVFLGRNTILSCKNGDIVLGDHVNIGFNCEIFSGSKVVVGPYGLLAAYAYLVGGGHDFSAAATPVIEQQRVSSGITLGRNVWLGTGSKVLDGVSIGDDVVIGANAVVNEDLAAGVVAAGIPARVLRRRSAVPGGE